MRIRFATGTFPKITETFLINQIVGLLNRDQDVTVFAQARPDEEVTHEIVDEYDLYDRTDYLPNPNSIADGLGLLLKNVPHLLRDDSVPARVLLSELGAGTGFPRRVSNLRTVLEQERHDIFHAHFGYRGNSFLGVAKCSDVPYVVSFYGSDASQVLRHDPDRYEELFRYADAVTALSNDMKSDLVAAGCPDDKISIQSLCINTEQFSYKPRTLADGESLRLLTVARFVEKKGLQYALEAVASLAETYDISYQIVGDGERRRLIEKQIEDHELTDTVEILGWQPQSTVADLMSEAHLFLLPSVQAESGDKEGTPTVLLEAQSMGLPVVSTHHAGIPEIVDDGESGILVPERDSDALSDAIEEMIDRAAEWPEMGKHGREGVKESHSIESVSGNLLQLYRSLL